MSEPNPRMHAWNEARRVRLDHGRVRELFESGHTAKEIAAVMGCSTYPVKRALVGMGLRRPAKQRQGQMAGALNPAWKGGRRTRPDGYVEVWTISGPMLEHRVVVERELGRALSADEIVHHRDGNKQNNSFENLEVMTQSEHTRHHAPSLHAARWMR